MDELNHRVKNNLTTVLAIAKQTLKQTRDPQQFEASFMGRILALSRAHSLLSAETWRGANLRDLVRDQMSLGWTEEGRVVQSGDAILLEPQTASHVALMLHELVTNATKYGAMACPLGRITIAWTVQNQELQLSWMERGGPPVVPPSRRGFGTVLIERSAMACGGSAKATYDTEGVTWDITLPLVGGFCQDSRQT